MVCCIAGLPCPALCQDHIIVGLKEVPCVVRVAPCAATDKAVALAVVHLAGKTVRIRSVVGVIIAVMVRVAIHDIVVRAIAAVVFADAREGVAELMTEAQLDTRIEIITELTTLDAVMRSL